jgi:predicted RNA polymerase sigma factor
LSPPSATEVRDRVRVVLNAIYLLFNEGYNSTHSEQLIRKGLIEEAMSLCRLLLSNEQAQVPEAYALMALMCFHAARTSSRLSKEGEIILLDQQDRSKWDTKLIEEGNRYMGEAAEGNEVSSYHIEAAIAFEHCVATSVEKTNWERILQYYEWLARIAPSDVTLLNKAIAIMQLYGAEAALKELDSIADKAKLEKYYLYHSLLGEIFLKLKDPQRAAGHFHKAAELTLSSTEKKLLRKKIAAISGKTDGQADS